MDLYLYTKLNTEGGHRSTCKFQIAHFSLLSYRRDSQVMAATAEILSKMNSTVSFIFMAKPISCFQSTPSRTINFSKDLIPDLERTKSYPHVSAPNLPL